jgi:hypothetical protein
MFCNLSSILPLLILILLLQNLSGSLTCGCDNSGAFGTGCNCGA